MGLEDGTIPAVQIANTNCHCIAMIPSEKRPISAAEQDDPLDDALTVIQRAAKKRHLGGVDDNLLAGTANDASTSAASGQRGVGRNNAHSALHATDSPFSAANFIGTSSKLAARTEQRDSASDTSSSTSWTASLLVDDIVDVHVDALTRDARARARARASG